MYREAEDDPNRGWRVFKDALNCGWSIRSFRKGLASREEITKGGR